MTVLIKVLQNTEQDACIKIKSDSSGGSATLTREMLCYKPAPQTMTIDTSDASTRFQDVDDRRSGFTIRTAQWSGTVQDGSNIKIYRGDTQDLEHLIAAMCVGDTCQYEFMGQEMCCENEYDRMDMTFVVNGEIVMWLKIRKSQFKSYAGEYASYGAYEDDTKLGPNDRYQTV